MRQPHFAPLKMILLSITGNGERLCYMLIIKIQSIIKNLSYELNK